MGATNLTNGKGNILIGYMEPSPSGAVIPSVYRSGSHNLVVGRWNTYYPLSFGGIVGGESNLVVGEGEVVFGTNNGVEGQLSTILGGSGNVAAGTNAVVVGGFVNEANVAYTSILGGSNNEANAEYSTVAGGAGINNTVSQTVLP
jgi:hypothetical protein